MIFAVYGTGAFIVGSLAALACFIGFWAYACGRWEFPAFLFGWIPSGIIASIVGILAGLLWPLFLIGVMLKIDPIVDAFRKLADKGRSA
jgi:hypothetical protein